MPNRLSSATSPYLLQHAHNPVDWYPWGPEALEKASREQKPILLSVGYAACHWCHVMEHESFEDEETARLMNEHFVSVKVDREERPDLDAIYMDAVQAMTGQGGWPMTVFLTPAGEPFFAGTYFPPEDRHGLPGFRRLLAAIAEGWRDRRQDLAGQGRQVARALQAGTRLAASRDPLTERSLQVAHGALRRSFDPEWGGFGAAPKFPQPMNLELLLRFHLRGYEDALPMATVTLDRMLQGGIYDQLGGGFHRYSTDRRWLVPHFEKMLYDNAQLARVYLHAFQLTGKQSYRRAVEETLDYLLLEMRDPEGGFHSAQDADSEGVEGKFFTWDYGELAAVAGDDAARYFGALPEGNWEGTNVLWTPEPGEPPPGAREKLLKARGKRARPATDDKVLAGWNGLAVTALAEAGRALEEPRYLEAAKTAAAFVLGTLRSPEGRLLRSWRRGQTGGPGFLDDHALLALGCLTLYESTFELRWIEAARGLAAEVRRLFLDPDRGGFFQSGTDQEQLIARPKELFDNAVPSGNSAATEVLLRLRHLTGDTNGERAGTSALRLVADLLARAPTGFGTALAALDLYLGPAHEVAVVGEPEGRSRLLQELWRRYLPRVALAAGRPDAEEERVVPLLAGRSPLDGRAAAYVCQDFSCRLPVSEPEEMLAQLA